VGTTKFKVLFFGYAMIIIIIFGPAEMSLGLLPKVLGPIKARAGFAVGNPFYIPPPVTRDEYNHYLAFRDPTLGWTLRKFSFNEAAMTFDESGARRSPAFPKPGHECVSLYGDSFTFGSEVSDAEAWRNVLAESLKCRVGNFGVPGYGTDQALLRFMENTSDSAPVVILGIFGGDMLRNVNQYEYFLAPSGKGIFSMKPRFVLENGVLKLVPITTLSFEDFERALRYPETIWRYETFLPGGSYGPTVWSFPYTLSFGRLLASAYFWDLAVKWVRKESAWIDFLRQDHPSKALPTTVAIVDEFRRVAAQRSSTVLIVMFTSSTMLHLFQQTGISPFSSLVTALNKLGIQTRDLSEDLAKYLKDRNPCEIYMRECAGHLTPEGNQVVAKAVQESIATIARTQKH
jgi:hypothetical protein